jgi:hypothetical protein
MKTRWNKRRRRRLQQSWKPVVVTFYVARPTRDGSAAATASAHDVRSRRHESSPRGLKPKADGRSYDRRAELLEYSRQLRALGTAATAASQPAPPPRPRCRDTITVRRYISMHPNVSCEYLLMLQLATTRTRYDKINRCRGTGWSWSGGWSGSAGQLRID